MLERNVNKILVLATFLVVMFSQGCGHRTINVHKDFAATGGSRSDGVIKLSYEYKYNEEPIVNMQQGLNLAKQRCAAWGYQDAEIFGGATTTCTYVEQGRSGSRCSNWFVTYEYQCLSKSDLMGTPHAGSSRILEPIKNSDTSSLSSGKWLFNAETAAMKLGCTGNDGGRPVSSLIGADNNAERYQISCSQGILYIQCESGRCVREKN